MSGYPEPEVKKYVDYYLEMINDRMDEGAPEEEAVAAVGSVDEIEGKIRSELNETDHSIVVVNGAGSANGTDTVNESGAVNAGNMEEGKKGNTHFWDKMEGWQIALMIVLGLPLLCVAAALTISAGATVFSLFISVFAVLIAFFVVSVSLGIVGAALIAGGIIVMVQGQAGSGLVLMGCGFLLIGLSILMFWGTKTLFRLMIRLIKKIIELIKGCFKKGRVQS